MITQTTNSRFQGAPRIKNSQSIAASRPPRQILPALSSTQPSAGLLKAIYLPSAHRSSQLRFAGGPSPEEMQGIIDSLNGWQNNSHIVGPRYFIEPDVVQALTFHFMEETPVPDGIVERIALHKAQVQNIHNLLLGKPPIDPANLHNDALAFTTELNDRMVKLNQMLNQMGVSEEAIHLFNQYAAETAPLQYAMGFPDAVAHSADVAQLTFLQAKKHGATEPEALQALMVGWLHDPKLPGAISWSNLATHPAIASSIAKHLLNQPDTHTRLTQYLAKSRPSSYFSSCYPCSSRNTESFIDGIVEALSINNDSQWVLKNVILHKATHTTLSEPGIADKRDRMNTDDCQAIEQAFENRFAAPSQGEKPTRLSSQQLKQINRLKISTDLRGIIIAALQQNGDTQPIVTPEILKQLLNGNPSDQTLWNQVQQVFAAQDPAVFIANPKVKGSTLASHHSEVKKAPLAALSLATADPLLLSPHKVIAQTKGNTVLERLSSFLNSLDDNLRYLPQEAQVDKPLWRKQVLESILTSAQEVTGNHQPFNQQNAQDVQAESDALREHLLTPSTWQGEHGDFANMAPDASSPDFQRLLSTLKKHYEAAVSTGLMALPMQ